MEPDRSVLDGLLNGTGAHAFWERVTAYRPAVERLLFGLATLGLLDVGYLWLQQARGFEGGCTGLGSFGNGGAEAAAGTSGCGAVTSGPGSELLGIDNVVWGVAFYLAVMGLTAGLLWVGPVLRRWAVGLRAALLGGGALYSAYLTGLQLIVIDGFCALCFISAVISWALAGTQGAAGVGKGQVLAVGKKTWVRQARMFLQAAGGAGVLLLAGAFYVQHAAGEAEGDGEPTSSCKLADRTPVRDEGRPLVTKRDITAGAEGGAPVLAIEYFDPNCPHCRDFHEVMQKVMASHGDDVKLVYKPFPLTKESVAEIQALYLAAENEQFEAMLEAQYRRQDDGIGGKDLQQAAKTLGMEPVPLIEKIDAGKHRTHILRGRKKGINVGVKKTPTLLINGHFVESMREECIKQFIRKAKNGTIQ
jgi:Protein-disulfide isomerase